MGSSGAAPLPWLALEVDVNIAKKYYVEDRSFVQPFLIAMAGPLP